MAEDHRRVDAQSAQEVLLDNPSFLREIVERVLQELLEAEMTEHHAVRAGDTRVVAVLGEGG
jgi:transposase-like protein